MGRESWHYLYNRKAWKELRLDHLANHITPHKGNLDLFFDDNNLQSLCKLHHDSAKQKAESRKLNQIGCDINGLPIDEEHPFNRGRGG